jgi:hypothetical protein
LYLSRRLSLLSSRPKIILWKSNGMEIFSCLHVHMILCMQYYFRFRNR